MAKRGPKIVGIWPDQPHHTPEQRAKARIVLDFFQRYVIEHDPSLGPRFFGKSYTQHNPMVADGPDGLRQFAELLGEQYPDLEVELKQVFVDGDYVILHHHAKGGPGTHGSEWGSATQGTAVMDIFRLEGDRIVEHWDVLQDIPETSVNDNSMF